MNMLNETQRVVITGMGALSPVGNTVAEMWEGFVTGRQGVGFITLYDNAESEVKIAGEVKGFDPAALMSAKEARKLDRFAQLAFAAAKEALDQSGLKINEGNTHRIGVLTGSGVGGTTTLTTEHKVMMNRGVRRVSPFTMPMLLADSACGVLTIQFGIRGPSANFNTACASSATAIGEAFEMIRAGRIDAALAGGSEAPVHPFGLTAFNNMGALSTYNDDPEHASRPFDATRSGFVAGEGAGFVMLESLAHAKARGATILAELAGYGATSDAGHITTPDVNGAALSMQLALRQAGLTPDDVHYINAHGTSTPINDSNETKAIKLVFGDAAANVPISSTKSMTGHLLGATGALEAITCVKAIETGVIPPTVNYRTPDPECDLNYVPNGAISSDVRVAISNSFGFFGHNACLVVRRFEG
jgi:3-oxoacyl-[acyl-carrier-protein] synthase II